MPSFHSKDFRIDEDVIWPHGAMEWILNMARLYIDIDMVSRFCGSRTCATTPPILRSNRTLSRNIDTTPWKGSWLDVALQMLLIWTPMYMAKWIFKNARKSQKTTVNGAFPGDCCWRSAKSPGQSTVESGIKWMIWEEEYSAPSKKLQIIKAEK